EQNGTSVCLPCKEDEYIEYPNDFSKCLGCRTCREDQVELSPCRATSNTQCACKSGTFCSPDHPCEMCQKCRPRCAEDEVELAPCTPHSDRQCGPPTGTFSSSSSKWGGCWRRGEGLGERRWELLPRRPGAAPHTPCFILFRQLDRPRQRGGSCGPARAHPLEVAGDVLGGRERGGACRMRFTGKTLSDPAACALPRSLKLFPSPFLVLRRSFEIFARDVPHKDWKRYGRALDLLENDIALAEMNDKYSLEPFFQMLNTWHNREGMNASINTLLETLHQINLGGIAEDISSKLVQKGFFQYEVS
ncbi:TR10B factor, partial [Chionis minor]|nr:TR10B factor [Chionis minor]